MGKMIASQDGIIKAVKGDATLEGKEAVLQAGDAISQGTVIELAANATLEIELADGSIETNTQQQNEPTADLQALAEIEALQQLIESGEDPTEELPETAAGNTPSSQGTSSFINVDRSGSETLADAKHDTAAVTQAPVLTSIQPQDAFEDSPTLTANDSQTINEDGVATGNVLANDSDLDTELTVVSFEINGSDFPAGTEVTLEGGVLVLNPDGSYTFTPNPDWNGDLPVITYTTNTGATATLTIVVNPVDDPSVLADDSTTIAEDEIATGNVLDNDEDPDSDLSVITFTVGGIEYPAGTEVPLEGGVLVINPDGSYTFTPNPDWNGDLPVITYTTNTGATATLTIVVNPVDDPSVLADDSTTITEDEIATGNVLDNDEDPDSDLSVVTFTVGGTEYPAGTEVPVEGGILVINPNGGYSFTPAPDWNGELPEITYTTNTGETATLTISVTPVDDPSVLADDSTTIAEDEIATGNVL
ncbi:retention module-containing protein, partial [Shewanella gelidii]